MQANTPKRSQRILPDMKALAKQKLEAAMKEKLAAKKLSGGYETEPSFIPYVPKKGKNAGKRVVKVGVKRTDQPDNAFLAIKLYSSHVRAIIACIEAGHAALLQEMLAAVDEHGDDNE